MEPVIQLNDVGKTYHGIQVLRNISLSITKGTTIGIVGGNGSGKSVLFKMICGFIKPDHGEVKIRNRQLGKEIDFPEDVGVFINSPGYIEIFTGLQNLKFLADIRGLISLADIRETMLLVGLDPDNKAKVKNYSLGMKQKLGITQAIMEKQDILILDEPFNALDHKTYKDIKDLIKKMKEQGVTILLTSHHYEDIQELCDQIYYIQDGDLSTVSNEVEQTLTD